MARPLRIEYEGAWYHVMNRGAGGRPVFTTERDHLDFLEAVAESCERFALEIHAYCLMGNHYHLLAHTPRGNLGRAMRHLGSVYTQRHNRAHRRDGPLFRGRYKAILVDADAYLLAVSRYIHRNPVEAGLVERPERYRWSSYAAYLGRRAAPPWLRLDAVLARCGGGERTAGYRAFVMDGIDAELRAFYESSAPGAVLGGERFRAALTTEVAVERSDPERPEARRLLEQPSLVRIAELTAAAFGVAVERLYERRRGRGNVNLPRLAAMALSRNPGDHALAAIAAAFGVRHYTTVSVAANRLERRMRDDRELAATIAALRHELSAGRLN